MENSQPPPHLRGAHGVGHQHGGGQQAHAAGHRRIGSGQLEAPGMYVAHQRRTVFGEGSFAFGVTGKKAVELGAGR
jgi:hypothetical protein